MEVLREVWAKVAPHWVWLLVLLAVAMGVAIVWWLYHRRQRGTSSRGEPRPMRSGQLLRIRQRFLSGLPWRNRPAILHLPTVVVLGPAGSGKTRLIELDVDWQRQARQFLPSHTSDPLLQIYVGPDSVVQEVSAPLLEDDSPQARGALRRLWKDCFLRQNQGLAVIALDVRWLADSLPDEVRRTAHLLRGKLNLISEVRKGPLETRLCLTHMDALEGYTDFARLLRQHGAPLSFVLSQHGIEAQLAVLLEEQEQYLALGLTTLPVDAFERLERFYSQGGKSFAALARFVTALLEGSTLSPKPHLSRLSLSSAVPETRATGVLTPTPEATSAKEQLHKGYLRTHLRRCALITAVCCLPVLAAHGNFYRLFLEAEREMDAFEEMGREHRQRNVKIPESVVREHVFEAGRAMEKLDQASDYWPPLAHSFPHQWATLSDKLSRLIRKEYFRPALERCQQQLEQHKEPQELAKCRPEEVAYLLVTLRASYNEKLGEFILSQLAPQAGSTPALLRSRSRPASLPQATGSPDSPSGSTAKRSSINLNENLVEYYIKNSDCPWGLTREKREQLVGTKGNYEWMEPCILEPSSPSKIEEWARWPYDETTLALETQLEPWREYLSGLRDILNAETLNPAMLKERRKQWDNKRSQLQLQLAESSFFSASLPKMFDLLDISVVPTSSNAFAGKDSLRRMLRWLMRNQNVLQDVLRMDEEMQKGLEAVEKMSLAELLTRDSLWTPSTSGGPLKVELPGQESQPPFSIEFDPPKHSRELMRRLIKYYEKDNRLPFQQAEGAPPPPPDEDPEEGEPQRAREFRPGMSRAHFDMEIRPMVDDFIQRMKNAQLPPQELAQRQEYVRERMVRFAASYGEDLSSSVGNYRFTATPRTLGGELQNLTQPSSMLTDMLRDVANRANLEPLEGPYYESLRNSVAPFKPFVALTTQDKSGDLPALTAYRMLVAQLHDEINGGARPGKAPKGGETAPEDGAKGSLQLKDMLSPLGRVALAMLLDEEGSYLRKVDAWMDQQGLIGKLRRPFRRPFEVVRDQGRTEIEDVLAKQWRWAELRMLNPMFKRYPFTPDAREEVDPRELEVLRRKDGAFWQFVERMLSPVCEEHGTEWVLRGPLRDQPRDRTRDRLQVPSRMLSTLSQISRMSRVLWDEGGKPRPLMLQVLPLPLPAPPEPGNFITMATLKCGKASAFGYNQSPSWQDFQLDWWDQQTASLVLEVRSPKREALQYRTLERSRSSWSCFRLLEASTLTADQRRIWRLTGRGAEAHKKVLEIGFGMKGDPWLPFREVLW